MKRDLYGKIHDEERYIKDTSTRGVLCSAILQNAVDGIENTF